ncbi:MAG: 1-phosphofructokinase family hexose kinase, partial [Clostridia bacterium]|nr:1-phosphofructokinase family hexose kinase [Clostridia bacterium]
MIYTLTLSPSLDYLLDTPEIKFGETNRSKSESLHFGGKGINVSYVLKQLDTPCVCLGFVAGFTGRELEEMLKKEGLSTDFVEVKKGNTRINVKIKSDKITEINANSPEISQKDMEELFTKLDKLCRGDTIVLAGSTPKGWDNAYSMIMERLSVKDVKFVVDTSGKKLLDCLKYKPFLIKPNKSELEEILGISAFNDEQIVAAAKKLQTLGAKNVLVSMGENGALLVDEYGKVHRERAKKITPVSTVGAGDS